MVSLTNEAVEARYRRSDTSVDRTAETEELKKQKERLLAGIKVGGELKTVVTELRATETKLANIKRSEP